MKSTEVLELTIIERYLVYLVLKDPKVPKLAPNFITTGSFMNHRADQFSSDIAHIPCDIVHLMHSESTKIWTLSTISPHLFKKLY